MKSSYRLKEVDIVEQFPPRILWRFSCFGRLVPGSAWSGSIQAMACLEYQGRILELEAYKYMIRILMEPPKNRKDAK